MYAAVREWWVRSQSAEPIHVVFVWFSSFVTIKFGKHCSGFVSFWFFSYPYFLIILWIEVHGNLSLWYIWVCSYWANYEILITWVIWADYCYIPNSLSAKQELNFRTGNWLKKQYELFCTITDSQLYWQFIWTQRLILQMLTLQKTWVQWDLLTQYMHHVHNCLYILAPVKPYESDFVL